MDIRSELIKVRDAVRDEIRDIKDEMENDRNSKYTWNDMDFTSIKLEV